jgi:prepilin-type N-terminal cleavage/methylation domain-containing protein
MRPLHARRRGFTIVELVLVMVIMGMMAAIALPRLRVSPQQEVEGEARRVLQSLELARSRAYASRAAVLVAISDDRVTFFLDDNRDSSFAMARTEVAAFGPGAEIVLPAGLRLRQGAPGPVPGDSTTARQASIVQLVRIAPRGSPDPFGSQFTLYVSSATDDRATAAITMTPAGNVRYWTYDAGGWR